MTRPNKQRKRVRDHKKQIFTPAVWARWLIDQKWAVPLPDERTLRLREGIADFRQRLGFTTDTEARS
jgi:hypothetical protein